MKTTIDELVTAHLNNLGTVTDHLGRDIIQTTRADEAEFAERCIIAGLRMATEVTQNASRYMTREEIAAAILSLIPEGEVEG